jgi:hypothetical protein
VPPPAALVAIDADGGRRGAETRYGEISAVSRVLDKNVQRAGSGDVVDDDVEGI